MVQTNEKKSKLADKTFSHKYDDGKTTLNFCFKTNKWQINSQNGRNKIDDYLHTKQR